MSDLRFPLAGRRVWVAGHDGLVGGALMRRLPGYLVPRLAREVPGAPAKVPIAVDPRALASTGQ